MTIGSNTGGMSREQWVGDVAKTANRGDIAFDGKGEARVEHTWNGNRVTIILPENVALNATALREKLGDVFDTLNAPQNASSIEKKHTIHVPEKAQASEEKSSKGLQRLSGAIEKFIQSTSSNVMHSLGKVAHTPEKATHLTGKAFHSAEKAAGRLSTEMKLTAQESIKNARSSTLLTPLHVALAKERSQTEHPAFNESNYRTQCSELAKIGDQLKKNNQEGISNPLPLYQGKSIDAAQFLQEVKKLAKESPNEMDSIQEFTQLATVFRDLASNREACGTKFTNKSLREAAVAIRERVDEKAGELGIKQTELVAKQCIDKLDSCLTSWAKMNADQEGTTPIITMIANDLATIEMNKNPETKNNANAIETRSAQIKEEYKNNGALLGEHIGNLVTLYHNNATKFQAEGKAANIPAQTLGPLDDLGKAMANFYILNLETLVKTTTDDAKKKEVEELKTKLEENLQEAIKTKLDTVPFSIMMGMDWKEINEKMTKLQG